MQAYVQKLALTNTLQATVDASIRAGSPERYTVEPASFKLGPGQALTIEIRLRVIKFAQRHRATHQGQKDIFHVKVCSSRSVAPVQTHMKATDSLSSGQTNKTLVCACH